MHRTDPRAGQRDHDGLHQHRQVDDHAVALGDAEGLQGVGGSVHPLLQVGVGDVLTVAGLALEMQSDDVAAPGLDVAVHAVHRRVELPVLEPAHIRAPLGLRVRRGPAVGGAEGGVPVQQPRGAGPEVQARGLGGVVAQVRFIPGVDVRFQRVRGPGMCGSGVCAQAHLVSAFRSITPSRASVSLPSSASRTIASSRRSVRPLFCDSVSRNPSPSAAASSSAATRKSQA